MKEKVVNYLYRETADNQKIYFFNRKVNETKYFKLKKDGTNVDEFTKLYESGDNHFSTYSLLNDTLAASFKDFYLIDYSLTKKLDLTNENQVTTIDNGFYKARFNRQDGHYLEEDILSTGDRFIDLGGGLKTMKDAVDIFYNKKSVYEKFQMKHKMGCLFYGPPGNGKTYCLRELIKDYKSKAVVIFLTSPEVPIGLIENLKKFDHDYIFVFEEITQILRDDSEVANLLLFLDGENSLDRQLVLATTNYPEHLPANLASRPGRFDKLLKIGNPTREMRKKYLQTLMEDISEEVIDETEDMSIAYLKEIFITSQIYDRNILDVIKENKDRIKLVEKDFAEPSESIGFKSEKRSIGLG